MNAACVCVLMGLLAVKTSIASTAILSPFLETLKPLSSAAVMGQLAGSTNPGLWVAKEMGMLRRRRRTSRRRPRLLGRHDTPVSLRGCRHPKVSSSIFFQEVTRIPFPQMFSYAWDTWAPRQDQRYFLLVQNFTPFNVRWPIRHFVWISERKENNSAAHLTAASDKKTELWLFQQNKSICI